MKQLLDYIPLIAFFIVYKMDERLVQLGAYQFTLGGIFSATKILLLASILVYGGVWLVKRKLEKSQLITLVAVLVFCSFTILFQSESILKWKAPVVNWIFAALFFASHYLPSKNATQLMMDHAIDLPLPVWNRLNMSWALFFLLLGGANLYVAFTFHEYWVDFKVFGSLGLIFIFIIGQAVYMNKYIQDDEEESPPEPEEKLGSQ